MTPEQFCYWLQGFAELNGSAPNKEQWKSINEHLQATFKKTTPTAPGQLDRAVAVAGFHPPLLQC